MFCFFLFVFCTFAQLLENSVLVSRLLSPLLDRMGLTFVALWQANRCVGTRRTSLCGNTNKPVSIYKPSLRCGVTHCIPPGHVDAKHLKYTSGVRGGSASCHVSALAARPAKMTHASTVAMTQPTWRKKHTNKITNKQSNKPKKKKTWSKMVSNNSAHFLRCFTCVSQAGDSLEPLATFGGSV